MTTRPHLRPRAARDRRRPLGLLVLLAPMKWRLIGEVSALDRSRLGKALQRTARIADDLDRELGRGLRRSRL